MVLLTAILTATHAVSFIRKQAVLDFLEGFLFAVQVYVLVDTCRRLAKIRSWQPRSGHLRAWKSILHRWLVASYITSFLA